MDLFPITLNNRDMDTLMRILEEHVDDATSSLIFGMDGPQNLDEVKATVSQMSSKEMSRFLDTFRTELDIVLKEGGAIAVDPELGEPNPRQLEAILSLRKAIATLYALKGRIRRSRN